MVIDWRRRGLVAARLAWSGTLTASRETVWARSVNSWKSMQLHLGCREVRAVGCTEVASLCRRCTT